MTKSFRDSCGNMWYQRSYSEPFYPYMTKVRAAWHKVCFQRVLDSAKVVPVSEIVCDFNGQGLKVQLGEESIRFENLEIASLLIPDDVVPLASSARDLQHTLGRFAAECEAVGMTVRTFKSEATVVCRKTVDCSLVCLCVIFMTQSESGE